MIDAQPIHTSNNERVIFSIAQRDDVILEIRYYKNDSPDPFRTVSVTRAVLLAA